MSTTAPRFFHPQPLAAHATITLSAAAAHHAARALRLQEGGAITLFDGHGGEYPAAITRITRQSVVVRTAARLDVECESPLQIVLAQGLSGGDKMDFTLQKAVELGVARIQPLAMQRSVVKLAGARAQKRGEHWQGVVSAACEQCGRNRVPQVMPILALPDWLAQQKTEPAALRLLLSPRAERTLRDLHKPDGAVVFLAGPEGGCAPEEEQLAALAGFTPLRLGPRILRTETAALAALSAMQTRWGDWGA